MSPDRELVHERLGAVAWSIGEAARSHPTMVFRLRSLLSLEVLVRDVNSLAQISKGRLLRVKSSLASYRDFLALAGLRLVIVPRRLATDLLRDEAAAGRPLPLALATPSDLESSLHVVRRSSRLDDVAFHARGGSMEKAFRRPQAALDKVTGYQILQQLAVSEHSLAVQALDAEAFLGGESPWQEVEAVANTSWEADR